jgi:hypothetical protein
MNPMPSSFNARTASASSGVTWRFTYWNGLDVDSRSTSDALRSAPQSSSALQSADAVPFGLSISLGTA